MTPRSTTTQGNVGESGWAYGLGLIVSSLGHRCRHYWPSSVIASFAEYAIAAGAYLGAAIIEFCHRLIILFRHRTLSLAVALAIAFSLTSETAWGQTTTINTATTSKQTNSVPLDSFIVTSAGSISTTNSHSSGDGISN